MNYLITPEFEALIGVARLDSFNRHPHTVYGLDSALNISFLNPASVNFFEENKGISISTHESFFGKNILDITPEVLKPVYKKLFESTLNDNKASISPKHLEYECSSPELFRRYSMHLYPLGNKGLSIVHSLLVEEPYQTAKTNVGIVFDEANYIDKNGILVQCANCRRIKNLNHENQWDWIPKWVKQNYPNTSHGICKTCKQHYYPGKNKTISQQNSLSK